MLTACVPYLWYDSVFAIILLSGFNVQVRSGMIVCLRRYRCAVYIEVCGMFACSQLDCSACSMWYDRVLAIIQLCRCNVCVWNVRECSRARNSMAVCV